MGKCAFSAPHSDVTDVGMDLLRSGASAIDAMIAAAAAMSVAYPHMNGLGGDAFWLISQVGKAPVAIDGAGVAMKYLSVESYPNGFPARGAQACISLPGAVASWSLARDRASELSSLTALPLSDLLSPAMALAKKGVKVTTTLSNACQKLDSQLDLALPIFSELAQAYVKPVVNKNSAVVYNPALADTFQQLAAKGLGDFYRGDIAQALIGSMNRAGVALTANDFLEYSAEYCSSIEISLRHAKVYNLPAPTQGFASLVILGLFDRLYRSDMDESSQIHILVEATKKAFKLRAAYLGDPKWTKGKESAFLQDSYLDELASDISLSKASPWPEESQPGDTVWMGCVDKTGLMVSFIQSLYWEFGSGVMCPSTGIVWNNRGCSFSLEPGHPNVLAAGKRPLHTLNPAYAQFNDGRRLVYGTMGGDGQPQTQAAIYTRFAYNHLNLSEAIKKDRWLLGRTWGDFSTDLKIEKNLADIVGNNLRSKGHVTRSVPTLSEMMGHAGAVCLGADGNIDCASDPRSDGKAVWH